MKNLLILIVAIALFLHFFPQPEVDEWYLENKAMVVGMFSDATDTHVRLRPQKVYEDLEPKLNTFRESEIKNLKAITSSRENVSEFYNAYCKANKRSPQFHIENQKKVCGVINKYANML